MNLLKKFEATKQDGAVRIESATEPWIEALIILLFGYFCFYMGMRCERNGYVNSLDDYPVEQQEIKEYTSTPIISGYRRSPESKVR